MTLKIFIKQFAALSVIAWAAAASAQNAISGTNAAAAAPGGKDVIESGSSSAQEENWNLHLQNTDIVQYHPNFPAAYSGPNSLQDTADVKETVSVDLTAGVRLWSGAEAFADGLMYQGYGFNNAVGAEGFPNGEAFRVGTTPPRFDLSHLLLRQTIGLGGDQEDVPDDPLHLAGKQDISRITLTLGRMSVTDIFDNNSYAGDARTQFMNWALMANEGFDYAADALGFTTGFAAELNQPDWTLRYGVFQVPKNSNGMAIDLELLNAWQMVTEFEYRYTLAGHAGVIRPLAYLTRAHMGKFDEALDNTADPTDLAATRAYRMKYGLGLNMEQEIVKDVGAFMRLGWNNDQTEPWAFSDVGWTASTGLSIKGSFWSRPDDTYGLAGVVSGASRAEQEFLAAGGTLILAGDGALTYGTEDILETYYDFQVTKHVHFALDYQFIDNPAFNRDRGPISVLGARVHVEF